MTAAPENPRGLMAAEFVKAKALPAGRSVLSRGLRGTPFGGNNLLSLEMRGRLVQMAACTQFDPLLIPEPVRRIRCALADHEVYVVGGIVRDSILAALEAGREVVDRVAGNDWDLATSATPDVVMERLRAEGMAAIPVGVEHGTVVAVVDGENYEITTFRVDRFCDGRHAEVEFARTLSEDLERRDFTVNAFAVDVDSGRVVDEFGGREDLEARLVRAIGDPETRFREDYLRLLRAVRFAAQIEGRIEAKTWKAIRILHRKVATVSAERVRDELLKLLATQRPSVGLDLMQQAGLVRALIPELEACVEVRQNQWHADDVWQHTLHAVDALHPKYPFLRFVLLLHDVAKPRKKQFSEEKQDFVFYEHQFESADLARRIMRRLRFPARDIDRAEVLIREHMFHIAGDISARAVRRFIRRLGWENVRPFLRMRMADRKGNRYNPPGFEPHFRRFVRMIRQIERSEACLEVRDLAIGGKELKALGLEPGPVYSEILNHLLEQVLDDPTRNERDTLLGLARQWLGEHPQPQPE